MRYNGTPIDVKSGDIWNIVLNKSDKTDLFLIIETIKVGSSILWKAMSLADKETYQFTFRDLNTEYELFSRGN